MNNEINIHSYAYTDILQRGYKLHTLCIPIFVHQQHNYNAIYALSFKDYT